MANIPIQVATSAASGSANYEMASGDGTDANPFVKFSGGNIIQVAVEITRPSDTNGYIANDSWADSVGSPTMQAIANAARVAGGSGYIVGVRATTNKKSITPRLRIHFYATNGATISGDNVPWKELYADVGKRVGYIDLPAMSTAVDSATSDQSRSFDLTLRIPYVCVATSLYFLVETLDAFTPDSGQKLTITTLLDRN